MAMMMLAPIAYAGIEIARVPLALALRTQPSFFWKLVFAIMVLCAVAVSVKSLSQLGEVMFRPRLIDVTRATAALKDAQSAQAAFAGKVKDADAVVAQRTAELGDAETRLKAVNTELGALPADKCARVWHQNSLGRRYSSQECHTDGRQKVMSSNLADAEAARTDGLRQARRRPQGARCARCDGGGETRRRHGAGAPRRGAELAAALVHRHVLRQGSDRGERGRAAQLPAPLRVLSRRSSPRWRRPRWRWPR